MKKIYFIDTVHSILEEKLSGAGYSCINLTKEKTENIRHLVRDAHGIVIRSRVSLNEDFLKAITNLSFIARSGSGLENIDWSDAIKESQRNWIGNQRTKQKKFGNN